ncbi:MAG: type II toxin-antitoxin system YafQ family toxin [Coriobacteriia bacterium]|nr:type II toxin-antitoxin system YafQ family toxin [Coriobacteriia bacterium]
MLKVKYTSKFNKDIKLAKKQNRNLDLLFEVVDKLIHQETLDAKYKDHNLSGNYKGCRECHIQPDWLLIYQIKSNSLTLLLTRLGSHSTLYDK